MLEQIRVAVFTPLVICLATLAVAAVLWRTTELPAEVLVAVAASGYLPALLFGTRFAHIAAKAGASVWQSAHTAHQEQLRQIIGAIAALKRQVNFHADELCRGKYPVLPEPHGEVLGVEPPVKAIQDLDDVQVTVAQALRRVHDESRSQVMLDMMAQFARREHVLLERILGHLDTVQANTDEPEQLDILWKLDHLVTRLRRWVESRSAAAGQSLRSAPQPVDVVQVLRGAVQEVEHYTRVVIAAGDVGVEVGLPKHVGPDVTHLLAELVDNATVHCERTVKVQVRAMRVSTGLMVEVEDRVAVSMDDHLRGDLNELLEDPDRVDVSQYAKSGKIGVLIAAMIARMHGIKVRLTANAMGGTTAQVVIPTRLLVSMQARTRTARPPAPAVSTPAMPRRMLQRRPVQQDAATGTASAQHGPAGTPPPLPRRTPEAMPQEAPTGAYRPRTKPNFRLAGQIEQGFRAARAERAPQDPPPSH
ncbi:histidine kinase [Streptomyces griseorubiginosus]|uniref:ATP-binding protein n=1 Tax=Streptomyces griseorubiginosus TaxID=67304 RepID=UPI0036EC2621